MYIIVETQICMKQLPHVIPWRCPNLVASDFPVNISHVTMEQGSKTLVRLHCTGWLRGILKFGISIKIPIIYNICTI